MGILDGLNMKKLRKMAKQMDTPEMRELYRSQKRLNPDLDKDCEELSKEIKDVFDHNKDS